MKAAFALLANTEIHNLVRKLSWDIHRNYRTDIDVCRLPPHVSLKQPFDIPDLQLLEEYMAELAASIVPFDVHLTRIELIEISLDDLKTGILWLDVQETEFLRQLHDRLNQELSCRFGDVRAPFDGPDYHFHMTVAIGGHPFETYQQIYREYAGRVNDLQFTVQDVGMFVYDDRGEVNAGYIMYKMLSVGEKLSPS